MTGSAAQPGPESHRRWLRAAGLFIGLALLAAAIWFVLGERATVAEAATSVRASNPLLVAGALASIAGNIILTALLMRLLLSRFGRVGLGEMHALIGAAALFNYLPMRPGLIGRLGYHKTYNRILIRDSFRTMIEAVALGAMCTAWALLAAAGSMWHDGAFWTAAAAPLVLAPLVAIASRGAIRFWSIAIVLRYIDLLLTAGRYVMVFALIGRPIEPAAGAVLAGISITTTLIPFLSNGLGLREWLIGIFAPLLTSENAIDQAIAMTGDLVNRSAELCVVLVAGILGFAWIIRHVRALRRNPESAN